MRQTGEHAQPGPERLLGTSDQRPRGRRTLSDHDAARRVRDVAVELHRDVETDQVAGGDDAGARNPVHDLLVDADEDGPGEAVNQRRSRLRPARAQEFGGHLVEIAGRDAGLDCLGQKRERLTDD